MGGEHTVWHTKAKVCLRKINLGKLTSIISNQNCGILQSISHSDCCIILLLIRYPFYTSITYNLYPVLY